MIDRMWDELGIAPCADRKAIRRAYAARLKKLDPDRDPNGFARLRDAFEWALSRAGEDDGRRSSEAPPTSADRDTDAVEDDLRTLTRAEAQADPDRSEPAAHSSAAPTESVQPPDPQPLPASWHDDIRDQALLAELDAALRRHDGNAATVLYYRAAATGALSLASAPDVMERLLAVAVDDMTLAAAVFRNLARIAGVDRPRSRDQPVSDLHRRVLARLQALDWYDDLMVKAKQRKGRAARRQAKIARLILGQIGRYRQPRVDKIALRSWIDQYKTHAVWLEDRIDPAWMAVLDKRLRRRELFWTTLYTLVIGGLLIQFAIVVVIAITDGGQPLWPILTGPFFAVFLLWLLKLLTDQLLKAWIPGWTGYGLRRRGAAWGARIRAIRSRAKPKGDEDAG